MTWTGTEIELLARFVAARTGLSFSPARGADAEAGIRRAMTRARVGDAAVYLTRLEVSDELLDDLITELTVGETYFLREPAQLAFVRDTAIPDILHRCGIDHVVRIWSAGCASGEEAYSLAWLLDEANVSGHVLGTDISRTALLKARRAVYREWSLRGVDQGVISRLFRRVGEGWAVEPRIQRQVAFEFHNLALDSYPSLAAGIWGMDLVLCRNVLIYLDAPAIRRVARGLLDVLVPGGWLVTSPADPPLDELAPFETVVTKDGVFYRKPEVCRSAPAPAGGLDAREIGVPDAPALEEYSPVPAVAPARPERHGAAHAAFEAGDWDRVLLLAYDPGDAAMAVIYVKALANRRGSGAALQAAQERLAHHALSAELHFLQAVLLLDLRRANEAAQVLKRVLYLDRTVAIASFLLGSVFRRSGEPDQAWRAFRNARDQARMHPAGAALAFADGETAGRLADAAAAEMALLESQVAS